MLRTLRSPAGVFHRGDDRLVYVMFRLWCMRVLPNSIAADYLLLFRRSIRCALFSTVRDCDMEYGLLVNTNDGREDATLYLHLRIYLSRMFASSALHGLCTAFLYACLVTCGG